MTTQPLFDFYRELETRPAAGRPPRRPGRDDDPSAGLSKMDYDMLLTRALHRHTLSHPTYAAMVAAAHGQFHQPTPYSIARIAIRLGLEYHSIVWHLRQAKDLFVVDKSTTPYQVTLSAEGQQLLAEIHRTLALYRTQPTAP